MYVLILLLTIGVNANNPDNNAHTAYTGGVVMHDFSSKVTCENAGKQIVHMVVNDKNYQGMLGYSSALAAPYKCVKK